MTDEPSVAIVTPILNEAAVMSRFAASFARLEPRASDVLIVDGGSDDDGAEQARAAGLRVISAPRGRAAQINAGVAAVAADYICVLHADTELPHDALRTVREALADPRVRLGGFFPLIAGPETVRWASSFHNWVKSWYAPLFFRPRFFFRGGRLIFGDQAMFFRRADFLAVGGFDPTIMVMEEADLCLKLAALGRARLINRPAISSDRRIAAWGGLGANIRFFELGLKWAFGFKHGLERRYPPVR